MSIENSGPVSLRLATENDIASIITLLLTSFRQFSLFDYLYSPLHQDLDNAKDTIFFWTRRVKLALTDPSSAVVVAELSKGEVHQPARQDTTASAPSSQMLHWIESNASELPERSDGDKNAPPVVGFAIWRWKNLGPEKHIFADKGMPRPSFLQWTLQALLPRLELWFYTKVYRRKDVDNERYEAYILSEEAHLARYYKDPCVCLDNLCVDFRFQRRHIGSSLTKWGIEKARSSGLTVLTETSPENVRFYTSVGFKQIGVWQIPDPRSGERIPLPVLQWTQ